MGQYRQWLHHRQVDLQLHTLKEHLVTELGRVQEQHLDPSPLTSDNHIVQALTRSVLAPAVTMQEQGAVQPAINGHLQQGETISQALFDYNRLPNLDPLLIPEKPAFPKQPPEKHTFAPRLPTQESNPLPNSVGASLDEHGQTEPQVALPWWFRNTALSEASDAQPDSQNARTNKLVQRWLERWGRQENQALPSEKANEPHTTAEDKNP